MTDIIKRVITATLIIALLMLTGVAVADKEELPLGLQWGMTEEEVIAIFAAEGITLQYSTVDEAAIECTVLHSEGETLPFLPGFLFLANLVFFPLDAPGYNDGQLRLYSCRFTINFDESLSNEEQQAKGKEIIESFSAVFSVSLDDETGCWRLEETEIFPLQFIGLSGSITLVYQNLLSLRN